MGNFNLVIKVRVSESQKRKRRGWIWTPGKRCAWRSLLDIVLFALVYKAMFIERSKTIFRSAVMATKLPINCYTYCHMPQSLDASRQQM